MISTFDARLANSATFCRPLAPSATESRLPAAERRPLSATLVLMTSFLANSGEMRAWLGLGLGLGPGLGLGLGPRLWGPGCLTLTLTLTLIPNP